MNKKIGFNDPDSLSPRLPWSMRLLKAQVASMATCSEFWT